MHYEDETLEGPDSVTNCLPSDRHSRALIFDDSMMFAMMPYLSQSFAHIRYSWSYPTMGDIQRYTQAEHPDIVIEERVERALEIIPDRYLPPPAITTAAVPPQASPGGAVDAVITADKNRVVIKGWGVWQPELADRRMMVDTNLPVRTMAISLVDRADVAKWMNDPRLNSAGFIVTLILEPTLPMPPTSRVCLWTQDPALGTHRLPDGTFCPP